LFLPIIATSVLYPDTNAVIAGKYWSFLAERHAYCSWISKASWWHYTICSV